MTSLKPEEDPANQPSINIIQKKRIIIMLLLIYSVILGVLLCFLPENLDNLLAFVIGLPLLILGVIWCYFDASNLGYRIGGFTKFLLIFAFILGLPVFFFQTRGLGAFKALGYTLLLSITILFCMLISAFATEYIGDLTGFWEVID